MPSNEALNVGGTSRALHSIASVAPSLAGLALTTGMNGKVAYRSGFVVLDANVAATLP